MKKKNEFSGVLGHNTISNGLIWAKKTTKLVLLFHENITKLVLHWPNMSQKSFKVLILLMGYPVAPSSEINI